MHDYHEVSNMRAIFGRSKENPGKVDMYTGYKESSPTYTQAQYESVAAHEFGHIMGVEDLYNKSKEIKRKYSPDWNPSIMNQEFYINASDVDIEKVLTAFETNSWQKWK
jgi:hypothetical protein